MLRKAKAVKKNDESKNIVKGELTEEIKNSASDDIDDESERIANAKIEYGSGTYNLFLNNCEHFATFISSGVKDSEQVKWFYIPDGKKV